MLSSDELSFENKLNLLLSFKKFFNPEKDNNELNNDGLIR